MSGISSEHGDVQLVVFAVGSQEFGIHISKVREIINITKLVTLPNMPPAIVGIIEIRGVVLPIVDLGLKFGWTDTNSSANAAKEQKVMLIESADSLVGFLVDSVLEVLQVPTNSIDLASKVHGLASDLILGICSLEERLIPVVDSEQLLTENEASKLEHLVVSEV